MTDKFQKWLDDMMNDFNWELEGEEFKRKQKEELKAKVEKKLPVVRIHRHKKGKEILRYEWERFINDLQKWVLSLGVPYKDIAPEDRQKYEALLNDIFNNEALPIDYKRYRPLFEEHIKVGKKEMLESERMIDPELTGLQKSDIKKEKSLAKQKEDIEKFERLRSKWKKWNWKKKD
jgi:hypothetical protein